MSPNVSGEASVGSGWIESRPAGWSECHLRWLAQLYAGGTPDKSKDEYWTDGTIPWLNSGTVNQGLITEPSAFITEQGFSSSSARWVPEGALVMALAGQGKTKGMAAQLGLRATCNQSMAAIVPHGLRARFLLYWLLANYRRIRSGASDDLRDGLNLQMLGDIPCPVPPTPSDQERIANFLDDKTARIDALIAEKELLLELLVEQRLSIAEKVIAAEKSIPRGKLGYFVNLLPGYAFPSEEFSRNPEDVPLLRGVNVAPGGLRWEDAVYWSTNQDNSLERFKLRANDVVFGMDRPWVSSGVRVAMVDEASAGSLLLQRVCRLRGGDGMQQRFLYYVLASDEFRQSVEVDLTGVSVPHISPDQILRFKVPVFSPKEQQARCDSADTEVRRVGELETHATRLLNLLREYSSSLISAAVTGQLDINARHN